jgi:hypothetical protein
MTSEIKVQSLYRRNVLKSTLIKIIRFFFSQQLPSVLVFVILSIPDTRWRCVCLYLRKQPDSLTAWQSGDETNWIPDSELRARTGVVKSITSPFHCFPSKATYICTALCTRILQREVTHSSVCHQRSQDNRDLPLVQRLPSDAFHWVLILFNKAVSTVEDTESSQTVLWLAAQVRLRLSTYPSIQLTT